MYIYKYINMAFTPTPCLPATRYLPATRCLPATRYLPATYPLLWGLYLGQAGRHHLKKVQQLHSKACVTAGICMLHSGSL